MLQYFKGKIDIGTGNGGILSQLKLQNELKLTDESWIGYLKNKGNEEFQKCMEELTDMQNHVLPYLQSGRKKCAGKAGTAGCRKVGQQSRSVKSSECDKRG